MYITTEAVYDQWAQENTPFTLWMSPKVLYSTERRPFGRMLCTLYLHRQLSTMSMAPKFVQQSPGDFLKCYSLLQDEQPRPRPKYLLFIHSEIGTYQLWYRYMERSHGITNHATCKPRPHALTKYLVSCQAPVLTHVSVQSRTRCFSQRLAI